MYLLRVESHFDAAHFLRGYQGKCETLHGHRFRVVANVKATGLNEIGIAYDFTTLKKHLNEVLSNLDHKCLNDLAPFVKTNPSSENIAGLIFEGLIPYLTGAPVSLSSVEVWESPDSGATYIPD